MKPCLKGLLAIAVPVLGGCVRTLSPEGALTSVPYALQESGRIVVDVQLNDRGPFRFALDTGASISIVFDELREALGLEVSPDTVRTVHGLVASGRFPVVGIERLGVGSEVWTDAEIVSLPGRTSAVATIDGILGIDFLRQYGVGFSIREGVLRLYPPELIRSRSYRGWASIPLEPRSIGESREPLYFLQVAIGDRTVPALFDLGAGLNLLNRPAALYLRLSRVGGGESASLADALETAPVLAQFGSEEVVTAGVRWRNEVFLIADLEIYRTLLHADSPLAILGSGLFSQRDFVIDFAGNRLLVRTGMEEAESLPASPPEDAELR